LFSSDYFADIIASVINISKIRFRRLLFAASLSFEAIMVLI